MLRRGGRYSLFVRTMRVALPVGAIGLLALVMLWPRLSAIDSGPNLGVGGVDLEQDGRVRLDHPRYVGEASEGGAYAVEAESARLDPVEPRRIELEQMRAELPAEGRGPVELRADGAVFDRDEELIELDGGIELTTADGYRLRTEAATVVLGAGTVRSSTPVDGDGPEGEIRADRLEVDDGGEVIRFVGDVRVRLEQRSAKAGSGS